MPSGKVALFAADSVRCVSGFPIWARHKEWRRTDVCNRSSPDQDQNLLATGSRPQM